DLLSPETQRDLDAAVASGREAEAKGDEEAIRGATSRFKALPPKIARDLDAKSAPLAQEAEKLARGNERALDAQNDLGSRLAGAAAKAKGAKAAGKTGKDLIAVARTVADLRGLVGAARAAVQPLLQAKGAALDAARRDLESWSSTHACEIS